MATVLAWTGACKRRGERGRLRWRGVFGEKLEKACIQTLEEGIMTKDLVNLVDEGVKVKSVNSETFLKEIRSRLEKLLA